MGNCIAPTCNRTSRSNGYCPLHFSRWRRHGNPSRPAHGTLWERFWSKVDASGDCWEWTAAKSNEGYGSFAINRKAYKAHRVAWTLLVGPLFDETIDHLCRNRSCVNPDHLEPVTRRENILRGYGRGAKAARQKFCHRGHPLFGSNLAYTSQDKRQCNTCYERKLEHQP